MRPLYKLEYGYRWLRKVWRYHQG